MSYVENNALNREEVSVFGNELKYINGIFYFGIDDRFMNMWIR
jgi:hypothetical protein